MIDLLHGLSNILFKVIISENALLDSKLLISDMTPEEIYEILESQYFGENMHEKDEIMQLPKILNGVKIFVDIGASLGQYTYFANKILDSGEIFAFEPDPIRFKKLEELCLEWEKSSTNKIHVFNLALADKEGVINFFSTNSNLSGSLNSRDIEGIDWEKIQVEASTLDAFFKDKKPDLIKMDVEGAEYRVLLGASNILTQGNCKFLMEIHPWGDSSLQKTETDIFNLFVNYSYDYQRTKRHWLFQISNNKIKMAVKNKIINVVTSNQKLREISKNIVLIFSGINKKNYW